MGRPVTLFTGQWADLTLEAAAQKAKSFGYDGIELPCWGKDSDHFKVDLAVGADGVSYCKSRHDILAKHGLKTFAVSNHLVGQAVCDVIDPVRHKGILDFCSPKIWGDGNPEGVKQRAAEHMKDTARAARRLYDTAPADTKAAWPKNKDGSPRIVVNGFTGSSIWHYLYDFPPVAADTFKKGYEDFAARWNPILDVFKREGVVFGLEVHPTEIAYDYYTAEIAVKAIGERPEFGFNFDPSHLIWQNVDPEAFIRRFGNRIYHVHMKDAIVINDGRRGIIGSHLRFADPRRGWDFVSLGHGSVNFKRIIRALNDVGYNGPLSVEWEDSGMNREFGAKEACEYVRKIDFAKSDIAFDGQFGN
jgi:sugar phosphate isomerase/epimerase